MDSTNPAKFVNQSSNQSRVDKMSSRDFPSPVENNPSTENVSLGKRRKENQMENEKSTKISGTESPTKISGTESFSRKHERKESISSTFFREQIRLKAQVLKTKYEDQRQHFDELSGLFEEFVGQTNEGMRSHSVYPEKPITKDGNLLKKRFYAQPSLLTELFEIPHIQTIHYIFVAVLLVFSLSTVINDLMYHGTIGFDFQLFRYTFGKFTYVITVWMAMQTSTLIGVYMALSLWIKTRHASKNKRIVDVVSFCGYAIYQMGFMIAPAYFMAHLALPPASAAIVVSEQIRFMMKSHAFVREKVPVIVAHTEKSAHILDFSKYLYFQFVPTLVYRDNYPRTKRIRWNLVLTYFANVLGAILYAYYIFLRFCIPVFENFNHVHVNLPTIINSMFSCILPGSLLFVIVFFALLHCWMNAFAEMLQFADRMFYKDWWNSTNFSNYYRTWNIVVHDWLYTYIYRDMYLWLGPKYRNVSMMATFLISALFHEYVFCCMFRFFYPVLFFMFAGVGVLLIFATQRKSSPPWNILLWTFLLMGLGVLMSLYTMEYYARFNCPASAENKFLDHIIPRSWTCYVVDAPPL